MPPKRPDPLAGSWIEAMAAASGRPPQAVADFLLRHDIREQALIPRPVDLTIRRVAFRGEKTVGGAEPQSFDFEWTDLGPGLWVIGSDRNLRGKTSLLGVMRWLLRGSPPDEIPPDVRGWFRRAEMDFSLDGVLHRVSVDVGPGAEAALTRVAEDGAEVDIFRVPATAAFEGAMSDFLMSALGLYPILGVRRSGDEAAVVRHRWPALFGAFHIGTNLSSIVGDVVEDGLPHRMLGMFAGFDHAPAVAAIAHTMGGMRIADEARGRGRDAVAASARAKLEQLRAELKALGDAAGEEEPSTRLAEVGRCSAALEAAYTRRAELGQALAEAGASLASAERQHQNDRLALQRFVEAGAAAIVFRALEPSCCPRCDRLLAADRRERERETRACLVCGDPSEAQEEDPAEVRADLEEAERQSRSVRQAATDARDAARRSLGECLAEIGRLEAVLAEARERLGASRAQEASRTRRLVLEALIADAEADLSKASTSPVDDETAIARGCNDVLRARLEAEQKDVFKEIQDEVLAILRALGVADLRGVTLTPQPRLTLQKGVTDVNFGATSAGERLRSKVAVVLALMKVANRRGIGRHPGILFIDTPGGQEMHEGDLRTMAQGLAALCRDLGSLQVFVATKRFAEFEDVVPTEQMRLAPPGGAVW